MSFPIVLELTVGDPAPTVAGTPTPVSLSDAAQIVRAAEAAGVAAVRLLDPAHGVPVLDPTIVGPYLAGLGGSLGYLLDVPTTHQPPYNVARRVLSIDRAVGGRAGLVLRPGGGDEVTGPPSSGVEAADRRWAEYAGVVADLWDSFPRSALVGDQAGEVVIDDQQITAIDHRGEYYRVAGPLDVPASPQGRPLVVIADPVGSVVHDLARVADVVVVDQARVSGADGVWSAALGRVDRRRDDLAVLGRVETPPPGGLTPQAFADEVRTWSGRHDLDGIVLGVTGGAAEVLAVLAEVVPLLTSGASGDTLRARFGLPDLAGVSA